MGFPLFYLPKKILSTRGNELAFSNLVLNTTTPTNTSANKTPPVTGHGGTAVNTNNSNGSNSSSSGPSGVNTTNPVLVDGNSNGSGSGNNPGPGEAGGGNSTYYPGGGGGGFPTTPGEEEPKNLPVKNNKTRNILLGAAALGVLALIVFGGDKKVA